MNMKPCPRHTPSRLYRGNTLVGIIAGLVIGLGVALGVAFYIKKAPVNFSQKNQNRTAEQDAQEARKNRDWDPNAMLHGKNPVKGPTQEAAPAQPAPVPAGTEVVRTTPAPTAPASVAPPVTSAKTPEVKLATSPETKAAAKSNDPIGDLAKAKMAASPTSTADPFLYYVQTGAFRSAQDAETQRAKLALLGLDVKVTERDQSGYMVYRVRMGPIEKREEADRLRNQLESQGTESVLIRVNR